MVLPETPRGLYPLEILKNDSIAKPATTTTESFLTQQRYEVTNPSQNDQINQIGKLHRGIQGQEQDSAFQLAQTLGADIYIQFQMYYSKKELGSRSFYQVTVNLSAFATTTAKSLGSVTANSSQSQESASILVQQAIHEAMPFLLTRINAFWKENLKKSVRYKLKITFSEDVDEEDMEDLQDDLADPVSSLFPKNKEDLTDNIMSYLLWVNPKKYKNARNVLKPLRKRMKKNSDTYKLKRTMLRD